MKAIGFQFGDSLVDAEMGIGAASSGAPVPLVRTSWPPGVGPATHQGCRSLGIGNFAPGGVAQWERRRGRGPDAEGVADMPDPAPWEVFRKLVLGIAKGLCEYPWRRPRCGATVSARGFLSLFEHLAMVWALGGHPETSAHPGGEWTRF